MGITGETKGEGTIVITPTKVIGLDAQQIVKVVCGREVTFALTANGDLYSWGSGKYGMLGHGNEEDYEYPGRIGSLIGCNIIGISTGGAHCCAWTLDGRIYSWGCGRGFYFF